MSSRRGQLHPNEAIERLAQAIEDWIERGEIKLEQVASDWDRTSSLLDTILQADVDKERFRLIVARVTKAILNRLSRERTRGETLLTPKIIHLEEKISRLEKEKAELKKQILKA